MSHSHGVVTHWRPQLFRSFVTNRYYANRDEYFAYGQQEQPYTFEEYYKNNIKDLKKDFRIWKKEVDNRLN